MRAFIFFLFSSLVLAAPVLKYSTYLRDSFTPNAIATDSSGNIYLAGKAIVDPASNQSTVLVVKLNPQASQYAYVRYLGGSVFDTANAIAVDSAGNAYIAGSTLSPDFPVTSGGNLGTPPLVASGQRSFVAKLDANGIVVFSDLLGGSAPSSAQAVAVNSSGQILVTGYVDNNDGATFPSTPGAFSVPVTKQHPYLLELDPSGTKVMFSATGIGGSALALDSSGNIYVAGTTSLLDYPTTPGAFQTVFPTVKNCPSPDCAFPFPGTNQYVTKVDPTGSKLIYSTAVTGTRNTANAGMVVDQAGNVYLTGYAGTTYPYTVEVPALPVEQSPNYLTLPFLTKLDAAGKALLFSVPVGGAGVVLDSSGGVYVGGNVGGGASDFGVPTNIPALAGIPAGCLPNYTPGNRNRVSGYVADLDASTGNLLGSKFIGGSAVSLSGVALAGSTLWTGGTAVSPDFPLTPNTITLAGFGPDSRPGALLGGVDFSGPQPAAGTPQVGCIVDAADLVPAGPVARYQLLTVLGTGLGPATGVNATDDSTTSLGGVSVKVGSSAAPLLYVSSTQINVAVPMLDFSLSSAPLQITVNGASTAPTNFFLTYAEPSLFPVTLNADGSLNTRENAAPLGSTVSVFLNGLRGVPQESSRSGGAAQLQLATDSGWSIANITPVTKFVLRVDLQSPAKLPFDFSYCAPNPGPCAISIGFSLYYFDPYRAPGGFNGRTLGGSVSVIAPK